MNTEQTKQDADSPILKIGWFKKCCFSLVPLLLLLVVTECVFRMFPHKDRGLTRAGFVEPDRDLRWRLAAQEDGPLATNELGLRDTKYNGDADTKILLLGDSVAWGDGIQDVRRLFPCLLERHLGVLQAPQSVEVINSAVPGYSTFQQVAYLNLYGLRLKPNLIILQFCLNDVVERYTALAEYGGDNVFLGIDTRGALRGAGGWLVRHSRACEGILRFLQTRARNREQYDVKQMTRNDLSIELVEAWETTLDELEQIRRVAVEEDIPFLLVIVPYRFQMEDPDHTRQPQDKLIEYARSKNVMFEDLLPALAEIEKASHEPMFRDANHFSARGHEVAAQLITQPVLRALGTPTAGP